MSRRRCGVDERWIRTLDDERAVQEGCTFDPAAGLRVESFFQRFLRHSKGRFAGQPFQLLPWQQDLVARIYGWKRPDGSRRFREASVFISKKNGKSTLVAGLELYHLVADGERGAEVYTGARDRQQAGIIFHEVSSMIASSPELARRLKPMPSSKRILYRATNSFLQALSADVGSKEGLNASFTCIDELHVQRTRALYDTLRYAGAARNQPLLFSISTAGDDRESIGYTVFETAKQITAGTASDPTFLGVIYAAEEGDDYESPAVWRKANPSLGHTIRLDDFARDYQAAKRSPSDFASFLRYRLNLWIAVGSRAFDLVAWDECGLLPLELESQQGLGCVAGLDLAGTLDLAALCLLHPNQAITLRLYTPADTLAERSDRDRVDYRAWVEQGFLTATPGRTIDYSVIRRDVVALHEQWGIECLCLDPWNGLQIGTELREQDGIDVRFLRQGFASLSAPTKELERLVIERQLRHGGHPVLRWMVGCAVMQTDSVENKKLSKKLSRGRIDGLAALVNAVGARLVLGAERAEGTLDSTFGDRGLFSV